jgi:hypothetical protein
MIPAAPAACGLFVPKLVVVLVGIATRGPRPRVTFCGTDVKLTESEIIDLRVAEAGARSTSRRRIRDDWRVDVHDCRNARVLHQAVDGLFGALAGWRAVANHLDRPSHDRQSQHEVGEVLKRFPLKLRAGLALIGESTRSNVRLVAGITATVRIASP